MLVFENTVVSVQPQGIIALKPGEPLVNHNRLSWTNKVLVKHWNHLEKIVLCDGARLFCKTRDLKRKSQDLRLPSLIFIGLNASLVIQNLACLCSATACHDKITILQKRGSSFVYRYHVPTASAFHMPADWIRHWTFELEDRSSLQFHLHHPRGESNSSSGDSATTLPVAVATLTLVTQEHCKHPQTISAFIRSPKGMLDVDISRVSSRAQLTLPQPIAPPAPPAPLPSDDDSIERAFPCPCPSTSTTRLTHDDDMQQLLFGNDDDDEECVRPPKMTC